MSRQRIVFIILLLCMVWASAFWVFWWWVVWIIATLMMIVGGITVLILWWNNLVDWASSLAIRWSIPPLIVGMTILAMGTSAPELFVNIIAAFKGETGLLLANVIGSNISNLLLVVWVTAIVTPLCISKLTIRRDMPVSIAAGIIIFILMFDQSFWLTSNIISRFDGILLIWFFCFFLWQLFQVVEETGHDASAQQEILDHLPKKDATKPVWTALFQIALGIAWLYIGGEALVTHASSLARMFDVSTVLIGASIVAVWTSVPELVTSVIAAVKKDTDMAVGNIIWSNIFNLLWVVWATALILPIPVDSMIFTDLSIYIWISLVLFFFLVHNKKRLLNLPVWVVMVIGYLAYLWFLLWRG